jgi:transcriptional regulator with XRE-family HTH domain
VRGVDVVDQSRQNQFADKLLEGMASQSVTIADLAKQTGTTYEHIRRLVRGLAFPSAYLLRELCRILSLNFEEMEKLVTAERIRSKYGEIPDKIVKKNPELTPLDRFWPSLTSLQKQELYMLARAMATLNFQREAGKFFKTDIAEMEKAEAAKPLRPGGGKERRGIKKGKKQQRD